MMGMRYALLRPMGRGHHHLTPWFTAWVRAATATPGYQVNIAVGWKDSGGAGVNVAEFANVELGTTYHTLRITAPMPIEF